MSLLRELLARREPAGIVVKVEGQKAQTVSFSLSEVNLEAKIVVVKVRTACISLMDALASVFYTDPLRLGSR